MDVTYLLVAFFCVSGLREVLLAPCCDHCEGQPTDADCQICRNRTRTCFEPLQTNPGEMAQPYLCPDPRFFGTDCDKNCSDACVNSRCELQEITLVCTGGCIDGKKGIYCQEDCLSTCSKCERYGSVCLQCREALSYGKKCDKRCPPNCKGGCAKVTGICTTCASGFRGAKCETPCRPGCEVCPRYTEGCFTCLSDRYYGKDCRFPCPQNCLQCKKDTGDCTECVQVHRETVDTGICVQCDAGYHATNCTVTCPPNCRYSHGDKPHCSRETGHCLENCQDGWWGDRCERKCSGGCEDNSCYFWDGSCARGCRDGWAGDSCDTRCPGGCHGDTCERYGSHKCTQGCTPGVHGYHCDKQCNKHCRHQDCFYDHGMKSTVCTQGCVDGWMSLDCKIRCPGNCKACSQETGECSRCKQGYWGSDCTRPCSDTCTNKTCGRGDGTCKSQLDGNTFDNRCGAACVGCLETHKPCGCQDICVVQCLPITYDAQGCSEADLYTSGSCMLRGDALVVTAVVYFSLKLKQ